MSTFRYFFIYVHDLKLLLEIHWQVIFYNLSYIKTIPSTPMKNFTLDVMHITVLVNISLAVMFVLINCQEHSQNLSWILRRLSNLHSLVQHSKKYLAVPHPFWPLTISLLCMWNLSLKVIGDPAYCNLQHWQVMGYSRKNPNRGVKDILLWPPPPSGIFRFFTLPLEILEKTSSRLTI